MFTKLDREFIRTLAKEGKREDGRAPHEFRVIKIERGFAKNAEGSALVSIGETRVLVGVKMSVLAPFPDTPDEGVLMVNAELGPKASPEFETGPPKEEAVELARVIDRGIRESKCIDMKKLCITPKEKVWSLAVDIDIINDAGNMLDAAGLAAVAALQDTKIPKLDGELRPIFGTEAGHVALTKLPVPVTVYKINGQLFVDPNHEEAEAAEARLTVASVDGYLCAMQKGGEGNFKTAEVYAAVDLAYKKAAEIRKMLA